MSLAEFAPEKARKGPPCSAGDLVTTLDDTDLTELQRWITERHTWSAIADALGRAGIKIQAQTLARHFGTPRRCACDDDAR